MTIQEAADILEANIVSGKQFASREIVSACGSDMMSDVLAFVKNQAVLLTGLMNPQVVRTAEMMDIICIVFVREDPERGRDGTCGGPRHSRADHKAAHV